jgi:hypothetical protein
VPEKRQFDSASPGYNCTKRWHFEQSIGNHKTIAAVARSAFLAVGGYTVAYFRDEKVSPSLV